MPHTQWVTVGGLRRRLHIRPLFNYQALGTYAPKAILPINFGSWVGGFS